MVRWFFLVNLLTILMVGSFSAFASNRFLTYQGRITNLDGTPLEYSAVQFAFEITSQDGTCVLYRETSPAKDMTNSKGVFDISIGNGSVDAGVPAGNNIESVFKNGVIFNCVGGGTYNADDGHNRKLRVRFRDAVGWRLITPDQEIRGVPFASFAQNAAVATRLGSSLESDFLKSSTLPVCAAGEFLRHVSPAGTFLCETPAGLSTIPDNSITTVKIATGAVTEPKIADGAISNDKIQDATINDAKLNLISTPGKVSGSAITSGTIGGSTSINTSGLIQTNAGIRLFSGGNYVEQKAPAGLASSYVLHWPIDAGLSGQSLTTDGSGNLAWTTIAAGLTSLGGQTGATQTFAVGTTGTAPAFSSASNIHTLNIPMASTAGTTAGLISKTDYDAFAGKLGTSSAFSGDVSGTSSTMSVDKIKGTGINLTALTSGQFLKYDGTNWVNTSLGTAATKNTGVLSGDVPLIGVAGITNNSMCTSDGTGAITCSTAIPSASGDFKADGSVDMTGTLKAVAGTAALPGLTFVGDTNTGLYSPSADAIAFATNGSEKIRIGSTGNLGIGTSSPSFPLDIQSSGSFQARLYHASNNQYDGSALMMSRTRGTIASGSAVLSGDVLGGFYFRGHDGSGANTTSAAIEVSASENYSATNRGSFMIFETTSTGAATRSERMRISGSGNVGIGTNSPNGKLDVKGSLVLSGSTSGYTGFQPAATAGSTIWTLPSADGTTGQVLTTNGTGTLSWTTPSSGGITSLNGLTAGTQTFAIGTTGTAPNFVSTTSTHTLHIPMASTAGVTAGLISKDDHGTFSAKLGPASAFGGDVSGTYTTTSVDKIKGNAVAVGSLTAPDAGKVYRWNGTSFAASFINFGDLRTAAGAQQLTAACAAHEKIQWSVITDAFTCQSIGNLNASVITAGTIDSARLPASANSWTVSGSDIYRSTGKVGVGTTAPTNVLDISSTNSNNSSAPATRDSAGIRNITKTENTADGSFYSRGIYSILNYKIDAGKTDTGTTEGALIQNLRNVATTGDNGTLANLRGLSIQYGHYGSDATATPTTTNAFGLFLVPDFQKGAITNAYDIYLAAGNTGATVTNSWGIFQANTKNNYFGGHIGIGTQSPLENLSIEDNIDGSNFANIINSNAGTNARAGYVLTNSGTAYGSDSAGIILNGTAKTPSPDSLNVFANGGIQNGVIISATGATAPVAIATGAAGNERMRVTSTGLVGIGTSTPLSPLQVQGPTTDSQFSLSNSAGYRSHFTQSTSTNSMILSGGTRYSGSNWIAESTTTGLLNIGSSGITFFTDSGLTVGNTHANTVRMAINNAGLVSIGASGPWQNAYLTAGEYGHSQGIIALRRNTSSSNLDIYIPYEASDAGKYFGYGFQPSTGMFRFWDSTLGQRMNFTNSNGNMWIAGAYSNASDRRLKKNITPLKNSLEKITQLHGVTYDWKEEVSPDRERQIGVIAQDVEKVFPEAVKTNDNGFKSVSYSNLVAPIIEAIKELFVENKKQSREIAAVKEETQKLKEENKALKEYICSKDPQAPFCRK